MLRNKVGTAPGMLFIEKEVMYVSLPGVPFEMKYLLEHEVLPRVKEKFSTPFILHRTLLTQGIGESFLAEKIATFEDRLPAYVKLAYLPASGMVRLRLTASGDEAMIRAEVGRLERELLEEIKEYHFGYDEETIQEVTGRLLLEKN